MEIFDEIWNIGSVGEFSNEHCYSDNSEACSAKFCIFSSNSNYIHEKITQIWLVKINAVFR